MGFGYLFLGVFLVINFLAYAGITTFPAILLMLMGMLTLGNFNRPLGTARLLLFPAALLAAARFVFDLLSLFGMAAKVETVSVIVSLALELFMMLFTLHLLAGIALLGEETELPKIVFRAKRNAILLGVAYTLSILFSLPITADWYKLACAYVVPPLIIFRLIAMLLNAFLVYSCYMYICMPEDLDMPRRKTGIRFLDEWAEKMDRHEEERAARTKEELEKIYRTREAMYREKMDKNGQNKKSRNKKK